MKDTDRVETRNLTEDPVTVSERDLLKRHSLWTCISSIGLDEAFFSTAELARVARMTEQLVSARLPAGAMDLPATSLIFRRIFIRTLAAEHMNEIEEAKDRLARIKGHPRLAHRLSTRIAHELREEGHSQTRFQGLDPCHWHLREDLRDLTSPQKLYALGLLAFLMQAQDQGLRAEA